MKKKSKTLKDATLSKADTVLSSIAGNLLSKVFVSPSQGDDTSKEAYTKLIKRFTNIHSGQELKKEVSNLATTFKECSPTIANFIIEIKSLRSKVSKRLAENIQSE